MDINNKQKHMNQSSFLVPFDSKYNYLIQDETTTFEVYKCAKGTECHPSDYATKEEREKNYREFEEIILISKCHSQAFRYQ